MVVRRSGSGAKSRDEQQEDGVADLFAGGHATLPESMHLAIEQAPAGAQDGQLPLQLVRLRQPGRVEGLQVSQVLSLELDAPRAGPARDMSPSRSS